MFCYQCEQTSGGKACTAFGVCGKDPESSALQDLILHVAKGAAMYLHRARLLEPDAGFALEAALPGAIFTTLTNTNHDVAALESTLRQIEDVRERSRAHYDAACRRRGRTPEKLGGAATFELGKSTGQQFMQAENEVLLEHRIAMWGEDIVGAQEWLVYGLKGSCAYAYHAKRVGKEPTSFYAFLCEALSYISEERQDFEALLRYCLRSGEEALRVLESLDQAHTERFGNPEPGDVRITPVKGKAILVSGHALEDLESLLRNTSINVYTHGEMLPAHGYPAFKKYPNLVGNYGGAWQDQAREFDAFPGPIVVTTNCLQKPLASYARRLFTTGPTGWADTRHLDGRSWDEVVETALAMPGFREDGPEKHLRIGYGRAALMGMVDRFSDLLQRGEMKEIVVIGGCDGAKLGRNQFTDLAAMVPPSSVLMTFACGKYRFNKNDFGTLDGMPRLLDVGQCNDSFAMLRFMQALAKKMNTDVGSLPVALEISWFEQKSMAYLQMLLASGVRNVKLGPTLPAFFTPKIYAWLKKNFGLQELAPINSARVAVMLD